MPAPFLRSTLDVALWLLERAESAGGTLNPGMMHCLLYLTQARFAAQTQGRKLMPATFVATGYGPLEPTVYHIFENGRPALDLVYPTGRAEVHLNDMWRHYAEKPVEDIRRSIEGDSTFSASLEKGKNTEITIAAMCVAYGGTLPAKGKEPPPLVDGETPDKAYYTQSGKKAVKWVPGMGRPKGE